MAVFFTTLKRLIYGRIMPAVRRCRGAQGCLIPWGARRTWSGAARTAKWIAPWDGVCPTIFYRCRSKAFSAWAAIRMDGAKYFDLKESAIV